MGLSLGGILSAGRDIINIINQNYPFEQFVNLLKERDKEILLKIAKADPEQRALLEKELAAIKKQYDDLQKAYEEQKARLSEASKALDKFKEEVPAEQIREGAKSPGSGGNGGG